MTIRTLRRAREFRQVRQGVRLAGRFVILNAVRRPEASETYASVGARDGARNEEIRACARFGFTLTRRIGNAVVRNRLRRRLKEIVRSQGVALAQPKTDYVLIARRDGCSAKFKPLQDELVRLFLRANRRLVAGRGGAARRVDVRKP